MVEYGCNVTNKFGFMSDDDDFEDPKELIEKAAKVEATKAAAAAKKVAVKPAVVSLPAKKKESTTSAVGKENRPAGGSRGRGSPRDKGSRPPRDGTNRPPRDGTNISDRFGEGAGRGRGAPRGRGGPRTFRGRGGNAGVTFEETPKDGFDEAVVPADSEAGRARRGRGAFGRGRGGRGRQFDRHSGSERTGVRSVDKKDGHGKGNWGDVQDEIAAETEPIVTDEESQEPPAPREKTAEELAYEAEMAEFNKMKTLKEFKAEQKAEETGFKTRKAGEGVQENFGKLVPLVKHEEVKDDEHEIVVLRKENSKKIVSIDIQFASQDRGRRDRGRGRGQRGQGRGGQRPRANFDVAAEDFPALQ